MNASAPLLCREIGTTDDLGALTELLHAAYAAHAETGLRYWATHQSIEDTALRIAAGHGLVGVLEERTIATITLRRPKPDAKVELFRDAATWSFGQFAVHPERQGQGHGKRLHDFALGFALGFAAARGCRRMALDTAATCTPAHPDVPFVGICRGRHLRLAPAHELRECSYAQAHLRKSLAAVPSSVVERYVRSAASGL